MLFVCFTGCPVRTGLPYYHQVTGQCIQQCPPGFIGIYATSAICQPCKLVEWIVPNKFAGRLNLLQITKPNSKQVNKCWVTYIVLSFIFFITHIQCIHNVSLRKIHEMSISWKSTNLERNKHSILYNITLVCQ